MNDELSDGKVTRLNDFELATRLSMFLWCSLPDETLLNLAKQGQLHQREVLMSQTERMLADPRAQRFSQQFVRQWLGMKLLDYLTVDKKVYRQFDQELKEAMQKEPVAFFREVLDKEQSIMDFLHAGLCDGQRTLGPTLWFERCSTGTIFRRVMLKPEDRRGGLLTQAGLLAMNSDGKDSHPLKRGIWLLESLLNDPPPPPPPAGPRN